ncbi:MAG: hypothetical protein SOW08_09325 [Lachnospiraceae bacterium]|nr:hypothetical protein [Lachnospiraceae bacterium]
MTENVIGFIIWTAVGALFFVLGIHAFFAGKPVGFWANAKTPEIENVKAYNRAVGTIFLVYGVIFILLGLPLLFNSDLIIFSIIGVMFETIGVMAVYTVIEQKYRKK